MSAVGWMTRGIRTSRATQARTSTDVSPSLTPAQLYGVGAWYTDFSQTTDDEVEAILDAAAQRG